MRLPSNLNFRGLEKIERRPWLSDSRITLNNWHFSGNKTISQAGVISAKVGESIGKVMADAMDKVGKLGVITAEDGSDLQNVLRQAEGRSTQRKPRTRGLVSGDSNGALALTARDMSETVLFAWKTAIPH